MKEILIHQRASASEINIDSKQKTFSGILFPISDNAKEALLKISEKKIDYVQLEIGKKIIILYFFFNCCIKFKY